jgi:hypothetical protein
MRFSFIVSLLLLPGGLALRAEERATPAPRSETKQLDPEDALRAAKWLQDAFKGERMPEAAEMLTAIAKGSKMGAGEGWFHPAQSRYSWKWLAERHAIKLSESISRDHFLGPDTLFNRLDRNKDGVLRADDFDWSDRSPYAMQSNTVNFWFRQVNKAKDGRLTREEWMRFFEQASEGKDYLTTDDMREMLMASNNATKPPVGEAPTADTLIRGLFRGEIGSMNEGPKLNDPAPDFTLKTHDGKETIHLSSAFGNKPIVLVFGNVTCGPFRAVYPRVDELALRYKDEVVFLAVYVREAHPTDGWRMASNDDSEVTYPQPREYSERCSLANGCSSKLKMSIPLLVDEMDDRVGHAYSGMPSRLYIIDREGKIAYKSGRGPFGFKPDEMEQSLVMQLLDWPSKTPQSKRSRLASTTDWKALLPWE